MKRYIHSSTDDSELILNLSEIVSITLVGDVLKYDPSKYYLTAAKTIYKNPKDMNKEELNALSPEIRNSITDVRLLRLIDFDKLTMNQKRLVTIANKENFLTSKTKVKEILNKLQECYAIHIMPFSKNESFAKKIYDLGGVVRDEDAYNIVQMLTVNDYVQSTLSYLDYNWNSLLLVFGFEDSYSFKPIKKDGEPVTIEGLKIYIKIAVDNVTELGYAAMSFHEPEFKMKYPYRDK